MISKYEMEWMIMSLCWNHLQIKRNSGMEWAAMGFKRAMQLIFIGTEIIDKLFHYYIGKRLASDGELYSKTILWGIKLCKYLNEFRMDECNVMCYIEWDPVKFNAIELSRSESNFIKWFFLNSMILNGFWVNSLLYWI